MNHWLRLIWCLLTVRFRPDLELPGGSSILHFRVGLFDLDTSAHMNNGRYLTLMDLGRLDVMLRTKLWRAAMANKWVPIASAIMIRYRRELGFLQRFRIVTRLVSWEGGTVVMEQNFVIDGGRRDGQVAAHALFKGGLYDRKARAFVPITKLMEVVGVSAESPPLSPDVEAFLNADEAMKDSVGGRTTTGPTQS